MNPVVAGLGVIGQRAITVTATAGVFTRFVGDTLVAAVIAWRRWLRWRILLPQFASIGAASLPVVAVTGAFIGMVLALEGYEPFRAIGQEGRLGGAIIVSVVKQIGPVLAAVMVAGRVGCALAAELGAMRVTEQIDALRAMAAEPVPYLVVPRVVACTIMTPLLTAYSDLLGVAGGWLVTVHFYGVPNYEFWDFTARLVGWWEPTSGLVKSVFFGFSIGLIACFKGFTCRPGAVGVGRAATEAFVLSFLAIMAINLVLAKLLNTIDLLFISKTAIPPL